jgi:hypothetical protein
LPMYCTHKVRVAVRTPRSPFPIAGRGQGRLLRAANNFNLFAARRSQLIAGVLLLLLLLLPALGARSY